MMCHQDITHCHHVCTVLMTLVFLNVNLKPNYSDKPIGPPTVNSLSALLADSLYRHFTNSVCNVMPTGSCIKDVRLKWAREVCVKTGQQWMWCVGSGGQLVPPVLQVGLRMRLWPPIVRDNWWHWSCMELKQAKVKVNSFRSTFTYLKPTKMQDFYQKTMGTVPGGRWATPHPTPSHPMPSDPNILDTAPALVWCLLISWKWMLS